MLRKARTTLLFLGLTGLALAQQEGLNAAEICADHPRVDVQGGLAWGEWEGVSAPYDLTCPEFSISMKGKRVTVKAANITQALALFSEESFFLSYYPGLSIRYDGAGHLTTDPVRGVPEDMIEDIFRLKITVTPRRGEPHVLMQRAMPSPLTLPADQAFSIDLSASDLATAYPVTWTHIEIDPLRGTVSAELGKFD